jgi:hypothetical protein
MKSGCGKTATRPCNYIRTILTFHTSLFVTYCLHNIFLVNVLQLRGHIDKKNFTQICKIFVTLTWILELISNQK